MDEPITDTTIPVQSRLIMVQRVLNFQPVCRNLMAMKGCITFLNVTGLEPLHHRFVSYEGHLFVGLIPLLRWNLRVKQIQLTGLSLFRILENL